MTDIEIARKTRLNKITKVAKELEIKNDELELYGNYKAKIKEKEKWEVDFSHSH